MLQLLYRILLFLSPGNEDLKSNSLLQKATLGTHTQQFHEDDVHQKPQEEKYHFAKPDNSNVCDTKYTVLSETELKILIQKYKQKLKSEGIKQKTEIKT